MMTRRFGLPSFTLFALLFLALAPAPAQEPAKPAAPTPDKQDKKDYSQEPFVFEEYQTLVRFEKDGTGTQQRVIRVRVQSEAGVQQLGQLVFGYNSGNEKLEIDYVRVRKADGSVVDASAGDIQDLTAPIAREAPVYTDFRQKHVTVPGLRPGEVLEYHIINRLFDPLAHGHFWTDHDFIESVIVLNEVFEVNIPRDSQVKLKTKPGADPEVKDEGDRRIYTWKHANLEREGENAGDEQPKKKKSRKPPSPDVQLTTFQSWEELGRWYAALERDRVQPSEAIRSKADELVGSRKNDIERLHSIYDFVAKNFRYVSLSFGVGRYQPHSASDVLANQYGDCKDKHTLLAAITRAAGLKAYPVLINSSRKIDPDIPSPSQFDHVISAVPLGSETIWMDTTTEVAPFGLLSANLRNKQALLIPEDGAARLVTTPPDPPFPATQHVEIEGQVSELGKLNAKVRYTMRGDGELILRIAFRRTPKHQWKQLTQFVAYRDGLSGEVSDVTVSDPAATDEPFRLEYTVAQAGFLDWSSKKSQLSVPLPSVGLPDASVEDEDEPEPLELGTPLDVDLKLKIELPANYAARAPIPVSVTRDYAEYKSSYKVEGNTVTIARILRFRLRELPAERTRDYLAFTRAVRADEGQTISVETTVAGAPAIPETAKVDELIQAAQAAFSGENYAMATELLKRALEKEPKHKLAWRLLGGAYLAQLQFDAAVDAFRKQAEINPYDEVIYFLIGSARARQQRYAEAAEAFRKQLEINPLHKQAQASLGQLLVEWRKYDEAVPELEKAITLSPDDESLHVSLGRAYLNQGKTERAIEAFDKGVELSPEPTTWNNVAYYLSLGKVNLDRAQQYAESAVAAVAAELRNVHLDRLTTRDLNRVSSLAAYWDTLGWVHFQRGDLDKAEKYVMASWLLDLHGEVGDHLAQIYEKRGRKADAIRTYALSLAATRPEPDTRGRLARLTGGDNKVEPLIINAQNDLNNLKTIKLGKLLKDEKEKQEAEFYVLLAPGGAQGAQVEEVRFIKGSEKLRPLAAALKGARYPAIFPGDMPTKIVRRGTLTCAPQTGCNFVLLTADSVTSAN